MERARNLNAKYFIRRVAEGYFKVGIIEINTNLYKATMLELKRVNINIKNSKSRLSTSRVHVFYKKLGKAPSTKSFLI